MPRFFFDIIDGASFARDDFGIELDGLDEARDQAVAILPDLARDALPDLDVHDFTCEVRNEAGRIVFRAKLMLRAGPVDEAGD